MTSIRELVKRAQANDADAQTEVIRKYMWMIDACSKRNGIVDEDCKQTILLQVIHAIMSFKD